MEKNNKKIVVTFNWSGYDIANLEQLLISFNYDLRDLYNFKNIAVTVEDVVETVN